MTRFCLVRHGQTDWNLEGRFSGQSDVPLNLTGREEAHQLAVKLQNEAFTAIISSDLKRAQETAEIIAARLNLPVQADARLREINQGEWEGLHVDVIRLHYAELWRQRSLDPAVVRPPGGETVGEVARRVYTALDEIAEHYPQANILLVAHGLSLATILCKVQGIPPGYAYENIPENAEPVWVEWRGRKGG